MSKYQLTVAFDSLAELEEFVAHKAGRRDAPQVHHVTVGAGANRADVKHAVRSAITPERKFIDPLDNPSAGTVSADENVSVAAAAAFAPPAARTETIGFGQPATPPAAPAPVSAAPLPPAAPPVATPPTVVTAPIAVLSPAAAVPGGVAQATDPVAPAGVVLDSKGMPWDARIHAESKNKIADGSWRQRRNLDAAVKASVEAELRHLLALNAGAVMPPPVTGMPAGSPPPAPIPAAPAVSVVPPPLPVTAVAPPAPPSPAPVPAAAPTASPSESPASTSESPAGALMVKIAPFMATGQLPIAKVIEVCKRHGIENLGQATMVPNLVPAIEADLMAALA